MKKTCEHYYFNPGNRPLDSASTSNTASQAQRKQLPGIHRIRMNRTAKFMLVLLTSISIIYQSACGTDYNRLALEAEEEEDRLVAVEKLTNQDLLSRIALEDVSERVRETAVRMLTDQAAMAGITADDENWRVRLISKVILAFDPVPYEHRARHIAEILPALRVLSDPNVVSEFGEIVSIKTDWSHIWQDYFGTGIEVKTISGEEFMLSINVRDLPGALSLTWVTDFPYQVARRVGFVCAEVNTSDILGTVFDGMSQSTLATFALNDKDLSIRNAALMRLTDRDLLTGIALDKDEDGSIRKNAIEHLTDQSLLAGIALEDPDKDICIAAVEELKDQGLLTKIALKCKHWHVRMAAVEKLTDRNVLARISRQDKFYEVCGAARERLSALESK